MKIGFRINLYRNIENTEVVDSQENNQETSQELLTDQETNQERLADPKTSQETTQKANKRTDNRQMILAEIRKASFSVLVRLRKDNGFLQKINEDRE